MRFSIKILIALTLVHLSCRDNSANKQQSSGIGKKPYSTDNVYTPPVVDSELLNVWNRFKQIVIAKDYKEFNKISLPMIIACHDALDISNFSKKCFLNVFDTTMIRLMAGTSYTDYTDHSILIEYLPEHLRDEITVNGGSFDLNQFQILKELTPDGGWTMTFDFIKTKKGYKFFGCDSYGGPICCH
jgi:hypothetical protein